MLIKIPSVIGHRGACAYAPENTLEGIHTAADMGIEWVELDVKLTKDGVPVLFHDETLERTSNGNGFVKDKTLTELRELEAGHYFADGFTGVKIPTLEEAIDVLLEREMAVNLEIKPCPGLEKVTAEAALDVLSRSWDEHDKLLLSSFQAVSLETCMDMAPEWARAIIFEKDIPENWLDIADYLKVSCVNLNAKSITDAAIEQLCDRGYPVLAYTVNDPDQALVLKEKGVTGFFSDEPDVIQDILPKVH